MRRQDDNCAATDLQMQTMEVCGYEMNTRCLFEMEKADECTRGAPIVEGRYHISERFKEMLVDSEW